MSNKQHYALKEVRAICENCGLEGEGVRLVSFDRDTFICYDCIDKVRKKE
jgi:hypothetical protein